MKKGARVVVQRVDNRDFRYLSQGASPEREHAGNVSMGQRTAAFRFLIGRSALWDSLCPRWASQSYHGRPKQHLLYALIVKIYTEIAGKPQKMWLWSLKIGIYVTRTALIASYSRQPTNAAHGLRVTIAADRRFHGLR